MSFGPGDRVSWNTPQGTTRGTVRSKHTQDLECDGKTFRTSTSAGLLSDAASRHGQPARMDWMDLLRGLAVLLVVVLHAAGIPHMNDHGVELWSQLNELLEPFRMPLLMVLSGLLLPHSLAKPLLVYVRGKLCGIAWPLALWMVLFGVVIYWNGPGDPQYWLTGDYLWFLMTLLICYALALGLKPALNFAGRRATGRRSPAGLLPLTLTAVLGAIAMIALLEILQPEQLLISRTLYYGAFFFLGSACVPALARWVSAPGRAVTLLCIGAGLCAYLGLSDPSFRTGTAVSAVTACMGIAVALWCAPRVPASAVTTFLRWLGRNSLVVYVTHFPVIILTFRAAQALHLGPLATVMICTVTGVTATVLLVRLRPRTPWLYAFPRARDAPQARGPMRVSEGADKVVG